MAITVSKKDKRTHAIHFIVQGNGDFPLDMLRYDSCHFSCEEDARHAEQEHRHHGCESHFYAMVSHRDSACWEPTVKRWESFCFKVVELHLGADPNWPIELRPA